MQTTSGGTVTDGKRHFTAAGSVLRRPGAALGLFALATTATLLAAYPAVAGPRAVSSLAGVSGGGLTDLTFQTYTSPTGKSGKYHLWASGLDTTRPIGLMLQFHGDGAFEF